MCCIQIHVLSDVGLHCSIVEEYILSSGLPFITVHTRRKNKNQQVESCLGNLICNVTSSPSFNCPLFLSGYAIYIYTIYIYIYIYLLKTFCNLLLQHWTILCLYSWTKDLLTLLSPFVWLLSFTTNLRILW